MADAQRGQPEAGRCHTAFGVLAAAFGIGAVPHQAGDGIGFMPEELEAGALKFVQQGVITAAGRTAGPEHV